MQSKLPTGVNREPDPENRIGQYINRLARMNSRWLEPRLAKLGLAAAQLPVFGAINGLGPLSQKELAALLHVEQPSMAQLLERMEGGGLIERRPDPKDGRSSLIHLTDRARRLSVPARRIMKSGRDQWSRRLGADELATIENLLGKMVGIVEQMLREDAAGEA